MALAHQRILFWSVLVFIVVFLPPALWRLPEQDEAMFFVQLQQTLNGQLPYRDFFQFVFPGIYGFGLLFNLALPQLSVALTRLMFLLLGGLAIFCVDKLAQPYLRSGYRLALTLFLLFGVVGTYGSYSHHLLSGCLAVFAVALSVNRPFWSGLVTLACLMTTQTLGLLLTPVLGWQGGKHWWMGWFVGLCSCVATLISLGIWPDFVRDALSWGLSGHYSAVSRIGYFVTGLMEIARGGWTPWSGLVILIALLPLLGLGHGLWMVWRRQADAMQKRLLVITVLMLFSTLTYSTGMHIAMTAWFGYLLAAMALQAWLPKRLEAVVSVAFGIFMVTLVGFQTIQQTMPMREASHWLQSYGTLESAFYKPDADNLKQQSQLLETTRAFACKGQPIFVYNASPQFYLLADRPNATRYLIVYPNYTSLPQQAEMLQQLVAHPPHVMLDDHKAYWMVHKDPRFEALRQSGKALPGLAWLEKFAAENYRRIPLNPMADVLILKPAGNKTPVLK